MSPCVVHTIISQREAGTLSTLLSTNTGLFTLVYIHQRQAVYLPNSWTSICIGKVHVRNERPYDRSCLVRNMVIRPGSIPIASHTICLCWGLSHYFCNAIRETPSPSIPSVETVLPVAVQCASPHKLSTTAVARMLSGKCTAMLPLRFP